VTNSLVLQNVCKGNRNFEFRNTSATATAEKVIQRYNFYRLQKKSEKKTNFQVSAK